MSLRHAGEPRLGDDQLGKTLVKASCNRAGSDRYRGARGEQQRDVIYYQWAEDLQLPLRIARKDGAWIIEYKNVNLRSLSPRLFELSGQIVFAQLIVQSCPTDFEAFGGLRSISMTISKRLS